MPPGQVAVELNLKGWPGICQINKGGLGNSQGKEQHVQRDSGMQGNSYLDNGGQSGVNW